MPINSISMMSTPQIAPQEPVKPTLHTTPFEAQESFKATLKSAIDGLNEKQQISDNLTNQLITGGNVELHEVMVASQKASITLNTTIEIRNKVIDAYQEIMRMTV